MLRKTGGMEIPEAGPGAEVGCPEVRVLVLLALLEAGGGGGLQDELAGAGRVHQVEAGLEAAGAGEGSPAAARLPHHSPRSRLQADRVRYRTVHPGFRIRIRIESVSTELLDQDPSSEY